jgi:hypothetical protein
MWLRTQAGDLVNLDNVRELALERFAGRPDSWRVCAYFGHSEDGADYAVVAGQLTERQAGRLVDQLADDLAQGKPYLDVRALAPRAKAVANGRA